MKRSFRRQPEPPQNDPAAPVADQATDTLALAEASAPLAVTVPQPAEAAAASEAWKLGGNSTGVTDGSSFLGTTDSTPLVLKTNQAERMRIGPDGRASIGTSPANAQLTIGSTTTNAIRAETTAAGGIGMFGLADFP